MKHRGLLAIVLLVPLGTLRLLGAGGCSEAPATPDDAGGERKDAQVDANADVDPWDAAPSSCPAGPSGWMLDSQYDEACGFCYPTSKAVLPKPIAWEGCGASALPPTASCRQILTDWKLGNVGEFLSPLNVGWVHDGTVTLGLTRFEGPLGYRMIADVDGPVRTSLLEVDTDQCTLGTYDLRDGRASYRIYSYANGKPTAGGAYGIGVDELKPRLYVNRKAEPGTISRSYYVSALGLFEVYAGIIVQIDWTSGSTLRTIDSSVANGGYNFSDVSPGTKLIYWDAFIGTKLNKVRVWRSDDAGAEDWLSVGGDVTQGAGDFATDDKDSVWAEGHGRTGSNSTFDEMRILTAPRTNESPGDAGRVIGRIHPYGIGSGDDTVVGCGYAARTAAPPTSGDARPPESGVIFRFSDGRSRALQQASPWT